MQRIDLVQVRHSKRSSVLPEALIAVIAFAITIAFCFVTYAETAVVGAAPYMTEAEVARLRLKAVNPYTDIIDSLTDEEEAMLKRIVWAEANNQPLEGQRAVIEVIFNRILSPEWPNDLTSVLSQRGQFATWKHRSRVTPDGNQDAALALVYAEPPVLPSTEYVFFDTRGRNGKDKIKIKDHWFGR